MDIIEELKAAQGKLREHTERRARQLAYRDDVIARARKAGVTWAVIQKETGLLPSAVKLALKRNKAGK